MLLLLGMADQFQISISSSTVNALCIIEYPPCGLLLNEALVCKITKFSIGTSVQ